MGNKQSTSDGIKSRAGSTRRKSSRRKKVRESIESDGLYYYINATKGENKHEKNKDRGNKKENVLSKSGKKTLPKPALKKSKENVKGVEKVKKDSNKAVIDKDSKKEYKPQEKEIKKDTKSSESVESGISPSILPGEKVQANQKARSMVLNNELISDAIKDTQRDNNGLSEEKEMLFYQQIMEENMDFFSWKKYDPSSDYHFASSDEEHEVIKGLVDKYRKFQYEEIKRNFSNQPQALFEATDLTESKMPSLTNDTRQQGGVIVYGTDPEKDPVPEVPKMTSNTIVPSNKITEEIKGNEPTHETVPELKRSKLKTLVHSFMKFNVGHKTSASKDKWMDPLERVKEKHTDKQDDNEEHNGGIYQLPEKLSGETQNKTPGSDSDIPFIDDLHFTDFFPNGDVRNGHRVISSHRKTKDVNLEDETDSDGKPPQIDHLEKRISLRNATDRILRHEANLKASDIGRDPEQITYLQTSKKTSAKSTSTQIVQTDPYKTPETEYKKSSKVKRSQGTSTDPPVTLYSGRNESKDPPTPKIITKVSVSTETPEYWGDEKDGLYEPGETVSFDDEVKKGGLSIDMLNNINLHHVDDRSNDADTKVKEFFDDPKLSNDSTPLCQGCRERTLSGKRSETLSHQFGKPENMEGELETSLSGSYESQEVKYKRIKEKYGPERDQQGMKTKVIPSLIGIHRGDQLVQTQQSESTFSDDSDCQVIEKTKPIRQTLEERRHFANIRSSVNYDIDVDIHDTEEGSRVIHTLPKTKGRKRKQEMGENSGMGLSTSNDNPEDVWIQENIISSPPLAPRDYNNTRQDYVREISDPWAELPPNSSADCGPPSHHYASLRGRERHRTRGINKRNATMSLDRTVRRRSHIHPENLASDSIPSHHLKQFQITFVNDKLVDSSTKTRPRKNKASSLETLKPQHESDDAREVFPSPTMRQPSGVEKRVGRTNSLMMPKRPRHNIKRPFSIAGDFEEQKNLNIFEVYFGAQNFDVIKFATYRTACKLRFIQKKTNLYLVDIWNVIEAFRENGLNSFDAHAEVNIARLESLLTTVYYHLNKRLPTTSQINTEYSLGLLMNWLLSAFDPQGNGRIRVLSIKVALSTLCAGKLMDKLRYIFTQISDPGGTMVRKKFDEYLKEILSLPTAVFEGPSFGYNETAARSCFGDKTKVSVNDFLDSLMSDPGPQCLMWLPILHRMAQVENVFHPVQCEGCHRESFMGFRYKCQRCYNYHLCQDCFWRGRSTGNHTSDHEVKEYSSYKSPAKQFGHSLRKSFRCVPASRPNQRIPRFPEQEQTLDLSNIVPATPVPSHNGFPETHSRSHSIDMSSLDTSSATQSPSKMHGSIDSGRMDEEHRLIARYAARLAADANEAVRNQFDDWSRSPTELSFSIDSNRAQRELIAQLEAKNKDILREIQRLRIEQQEAAKASPDPHQPRNPTLLAELRILRQRRDELEGRMTALQESRKELMVQLEGLMKLLKSQSSPRSTPNSSPRARSAHSPPSAMVRGVNNSPSTGGGDPLANLGGDVRQAFGQQGNHAAGMNVRSLRNDLLVAADSVTNAMSSLVKELNSEAEASDEDEDEDDDENGYNAKHSKENTSNHTVDEMTAWREEMQQRLQQESEFIAQLRARRDSGQKEPITRYIPGSDVTGTYTDGDESYVKTDDESYMRTDEEDAELYDRDPKELFLHPRYLTDDESYLETDQESYIRTDDEEGGGTDWEETMRRWVNR